MRHLFWRQRMAFWGTIIASYIVGTFLGTLALLSGLIQYYDPQITSGPLLTVRLLITDRYRWYPSWNFSDTLHPSIAISLLILILIPFIVFAAERWVVTVLIRLRSQSPEQSSYQRRQWRKTVCLISPCVSRLALYAFIVSFVLVPISTFAHVKLTEYQEYRWLGLPMNEMMKTRPPTLRPVLASYHTATDLVLHTLVWALIIWFAMIRPGLRRYRHDGEGRGDFCRKCGYPTQGLLAQAGDEHPRCPECGLDVHANRLQKSSKSI